MLVRLVLFVAMLGVTSATVQGPGPYTGFNLGMSGIRGYYFSLGLFRYKQHSTPCLAALSEYQKSVRDWLHEAFPGAFDVQRELHFCNFTF